MKTPPPIDLQATPSCLNTDTYIFNEVLLQCSTATGLLEYGSILVLVFLKSVDSKAFAVIFVSLCINRSQMAQNKNRIIC